MIVGTSVAGINGFNFLCPQLDSKLCALACGVDFSHPHYPHLGMNSLVCWEACGGNKVAHLELRRLRLSRFFR